MGRLILILALLILTGSQLAAQQHECSDLPMTWDSEKEAISVIESTSFAIKDAASPSGTSWMSDAHFFACDETDGYLIVRGIIKGKKMKSFVHQDVPIEIWNSLKNANSMGGFYMVYIKNYYQLNKSDSKTPTL